MAKILKMEPRADGKNVLERARERMERIFRLHDTVRVSFSGGKDSTVVLNLALETAERLNRLPLSVIHYDEEAIPYETEHYVRRVAQDSRVELTWFCLEVRHRNACSPKEPFWYPWDTTCPEKWVRPMPPEATTTLAGFRPREDSLHLINHLLHDPARDGSMVMVLGLRGQESLMRMRSVLRRRNEDNYIMSPGGGIYTASPIYDWKTEDVWLAPRKLEWDYNRAYDRMDQAGMPAHLQRCAPPYGEEPIGGLWNFKVSFPDIWERMHNRVPGANTAARYARTELYGFGGLPPRPPDMGWPEFIKHYVMKFEEPHRSMVARDIRAVMQNHYKKTDDPIVADVPHPVTGISWKFLFKIAMRGNFKGRLVPPTGNPANRERYEAARREEGV